MNARLSYSLSMAIFIFQLAQIGLPRNYVAPFIAPLT